MVNKEYIEACLRNARQAMFARAFRADKGPTIHIHSWSPETDTWRVTDPQRQTLYARVKLTIQVEIVPD